MSSYRTKTYCNFQGNGTGLILAGASTSILLADVHASVSLSQTFTNPTSMSLQATYTFGLPANAAICSFEMKRADGTVIQGLVKEKNEAKKEYNEAIKQGLTAALGAEQTKDVFSIGVGNISPFETVTIALRYLQTLVDDEKCDQVRFTFPRTYAQRYGSAPSIDAAKAHTAQQSFTMEVVVQQSGTIKGISCPSGHPMELELGKPDDFTADTSINDSQFAKVSIRDTSGFLTQDVVLVITATNLDHPRCFIEHHPSPDQDTVALGLTFVPRFKLPDVEGGMEYVFLVDRSGSMEGSNIQLVREALVVLLRGLPTRGTTFNIFSFGSHATSLWGTSQAYTQGNLETATKHVDSMHADYGGTEIASALKLVYDSIAKPLTRPVAVLLLTDGGAWDVSTCVSLTKQTLSDFSTKAHFIRIFTVGIGDGVSTDTCDSIARAGEGFSVYVGPNEPMVGKCARIVRAARTPPVKNLRVLWNGVDNEVAEEDDFEMVDDDVPTQVNNVSQSEQKSVTEASTSFFDYDHKTDDNSDIGPPPTLNPTLPPPSKVQQAPLDIPSLFSGTRSQFFAIVSGKQTSIPSFVTVKGTVGTTGTEISLDVPVRQLARFQGSESSFLHILAGKALITDREKGTHNFSSSLSSAFSKDHELRDAYIEKEIVRLGTTYGLSSRYTSFIAVDRRSGQVHHCKHESPCYEEWDVLKDLVVHPVGVGQPRQLMGRGRGGLGRSRSVLRPSASMKNTSNSPPVVTQSLNSLSQGARLAAIARLQQFDGRFTLEEEFLRLLDVQVSLDSIRKKATQGSWDYEVVATILAKSWLALYGGDESADLQDKASEWLVEKLGDNDIVSKIEAEILVFARIK